MNWSSTSLWDETFFVDQDSDRNERRLHGLIEEQYRIAYISAGAMSYHEAEMLSFEEKNAVIDVIKKIKQEEKQQMERAQGKSSSSPPPQPSQKKFSSREALQQFKPPSAPKR